MSTTKKLGSFGEKLARNYLRLKGFQIIRSNFYTRYGEIDIVAQKKKVIHFIEVKTRRNRRFGYPEQAVDKYKCSRIALAAEIYLLAFNVELPWQIDVIAIEYNSLISGKIIHLKNITAE